MTLGHVFISKEMVCIWVMSLPGTFQKSGEIQALNIIDTCLRKMTEEKKLLTFLYFLVTEKVTDEQSTEESVLEQINHLLFVNSQGLNLNH